MRLLQKPMRSLINTLTDLIPILYAVVLFLAVCPRKQQRLNTKALLGK